jgi:NAD(P)-dependent dehydrogenase (short-subunit alcohol dehydrogenase family)
MTRRTALVSGGNRGIGLEVCRQLARQGCRVLLGCRDLERGRRAGAEVDAMPIELDVRDAGSVARLAEAHPAIDILVNNAGVYLEKGRRALETDEATLRATLETNLMGAWRLARAFVPGMAARGWGRMVNVSSGMGQLADMGSGALAYRLSKAGLNVLTRVLAAELDPRQVKINSACPGWVRTDMGGPNATRSVEDGAETIVWLATLTEDGPSGGFFRDRRPIPW